MKLAGIREVAEILNVSRQRASQLASSPTFPKQIDRIASGPVWKLTDIEKFAEARK